MVVEAALGAALRVASRPHAHVHGKDGRLASGRKRVAGEQPAQSFGVDAPSIQGRVKASPAATMRRLQTQVRRRRDGASSEDSVGELEERIGATLETLIE